VLLVLLLPLLVVGFSATPADTQKTSWSSRNAPKSQTPFSCDFSFGFGIRQALFSSTKVGRWWGFIFIFFCFFWGRFSPKEIEFELLTYCSQCKSKSRRLPYFLSFPFLFLFWFQFLAHSSHVCRCFRLGKVSGLTKV